MKVPIGLFPLGTSRRRSCSRRIKDAGCDVWEQVGTIEQAKRALGDGVDVIVAQGHEAGGHNFQGISDSPIGTFALVPAMRDALGDDALLLASAESPMGAGSRPP